MKKLFTTSAVGVCSTSLKFTFVINFLILSLTSTTFASNVVGSDITYKQIDSFKYEITYNYYRYCGGVQLGTPPLNMMCSNNTSLNVNIRPLLNNKTIKEITPLCPTARRRCNNNQTNTGDGYEEHSWVFILDLDSAPFRDFKNCDGLKFYTSECCRPANVSTGGANTNYFSFSELDLRYGFNNSPVFTESPKFYLYANQAWYYNIGAIDTLDFDSLSFHWGNPFSSLTQNLNYTGQHLAYNHPFSVYYPQNIGPPTAVPQGLPGNSNPVGIYLNQQNGDIVLMPTVPGQRTVVVFEIKKWRKVPVTLPNGNTVIESKNIGTIRRELVSRVESITANHAPTIHSEKNEIEICEDDELCFKISTDDKRYVNPITGALGRLDTLTLTWNKTISGASFTILDDSARMPEAEFCWTPKVGQSKEYPYTFMVKVSDNTCPISAESFKAFHIKVNPKTVTKRTFENLGCGLMAIQTTSTDSNVAIKKLNWFITDLNGDLISNKSPIFLSSKGRNSNATRDTIRFYNAGRYLIHHVANNCQVNIDTIEVNPFTEMQLSEFRDTFVCTGDTLLLTPYLNNANFPLTYQWGTTFIGQDGSIMINNAIYRAQDTFNFYRSFLGSLTNETGVGLKITDADGCTYTDFVKILKKKIPQVVFPQVPAVCDGDTGMVSIHFTNLNDSNMSFQWYFAGEEIFTENAYDIQVNKPGKYAIHFIDKFGCGSSDSFLFRVNDKLLPAITGELEYCYGELMNIIPSGLDTIENGKSGRYQWTEIFQGTLIPMNEKFNISKEAYDPMHLRLELFVTQNGVTCHAQTESLVKILPLPLIELPDKELINECISYNLPLLTNGNYYSETGGIGTRFESGDLITETMKLFIYAKEGRCENEKSFDIIIKKLPKVDEFEDIIACEQFVLPEIDNGRFYDRSEGTGNQLLPGDIISASQKIFIFNRNECGTTEIAFNISVNDYPDAVFLMENDELSAIENDAQYQWYNCEKDTSLIFGAIFKTFRPEKSGIFALEVTKDECTSFSECFNFIHSSISNIIQTNIEVFPNPNEGVFNIYLGLNRDVSLKLFDISGRLIYSENHINSPTKEITIIGSKGVYLLEVIFNNEVHHIKVIKQ